MLGAGGDAIHELVMEILDASILAAQMGQRRFPSGFQRGCCKSPGERPKEFHVQGAWGSKWEGAAPDMNMS